MIQKHVGYFTFSKSDPLNHLSSTFSTTPIYKTVAILFFTVYYTVKNKKNQTFYNMISMGQIQHNMLYV